MEKRRPLVFAVLGSAGEPEDSDAGRKARRFGQLVAEAGNVIATGGCPGLPHAAALGARAAGGSTIAVSPAMNRQEHARRYGYPTDSEILIFTGMGTKGRNVILVRSSDVCVFVGGGMGTLNEFTIAHDDLGPGCAIGVVRGTGGFSEELPRLAALVDRRASAPLIVEADPDELHTLLCRHVCRFDP